MKRRKLPIIAVGIVIAATLIAACSAPGTTGGAAQQQQDSGTGAGFSGQRVTIKQGTLETHIVATGKIVARSTAQLAFPRSGTVKSVLVKVGDAVKAGQPLAQLDTSDLELSAQQSYANYLDSQASYSQTIKGPTDADLAAAQAAVVSAQAAYSTTLDGGAAAQIYSAQAAVQSAAAALSNLSIAPSQYDLASAQAALLNAEADVKQKQASYDTAFRRNPAGIGGSGEGLALQTSTNNYNAAKAAYDKLFQPATNKDTAAALAQLASARSSLATVGSKEEKIATAKENMATAISKLDALTPTVETIAMAKAKLDQAYSSWQQSQKAVTDATLKAPFDGMVALVSIDVGDSFASGTAMEVADFTVPQFEISVDEADMGSVKVGEDATVQLQSYPSISIPAKVERIDATGTAASGGIVTFNVFLSIGNAKTADGKQPVLLLSMSGTSQVVTAKVDNALIVPNAALTVDPTTRAYSVRKIGPNGSVENVNIKVGFKGTDSVQATDGLSAGDVIIVPRTTSGATNTNNRPVGGFPGD